MGRDMTKTIRIDINNNLQRSQFNQLFNEYAKAVSANLDPLVTNKIFELPYFHGFLCYIEQQPVAFAVCFESFSTYRSKKVLNIHDFMVSLNHRGQGMGKILLAGIEQHCIEQDFLKITLEVDEDNIAAQKLYTSCRFEDHQVALKGLLHWQKYL
ncbi:Acetyltransferase family protein [Vibrio tapetis subsp. tapetis]|uniref:Acetyltransferase family protein n=2 Tax=Vibrio tapetis TaxID=52443 RepID=A0A2N8Z8Y5_9VIBR|nr:Acetyltransferase family protein [Vibrio tapetis subsp. tapetis]